MCCVQVPVWKCGVSGWVSSGCRHRGRPAALMFRCKRPYTESRSEAPEGCTLPAAAAPEHNKINQELDSSLPYKIKCTRCSRCCWRRGLMWTCLYLLSGNTRAGRGPMTEAFSASGSRWTPSVRAPRWGAEGREDALSMCESEAPPLTDITKNTPDSADICTAAYSTTITTTTTTTTDNTLLLVLLGTTTNENTTAQCTQTFSQLLWKRSSGVDWSLVWVVLCSAAQLHVKEFISFQLQ